MRESFRKRQRTGALQDALRLRGWKTVSRETRETAGGTPALHVADGGEKGAGAGGVLGGTEERVCRCVFLLVERGWAKTCGTPDFRGLGRVFYRLKMGLQKIVFFSSKFLGMRGLLATLKISPSSTFLKRVFGQTQAME